jgi:RIO kinase 1
LPAYTDDLFDDDTDVTTPHARRRASKQARKKNIPRRSQREVLSELGGGNLQEGRLATTYQPSRYEESWLLSSLGLFFEEQLITDVLGFVKGGKEASVYCCRAHPSTGQELLAAKVYRPRQLRSMRNDAMYREGRGVLTAYGRAMMGDRGRQAQRPDSRMMRAIAGKSAFGQEVLHTSWLSYEFSFMERLFRAGAAVPRPVACAENAVLMGYLGEVGAPAPTLSGVRLDQDEAAVFFDQVISSIGLMLELGYVHGDLSAYNILYWEGEITIIDFPQVADVGGNPSAEAILRRDVTRVCEYFARQGVPSDPAAIVDELWLRYTG